MQWEYKYISYPPTKYDEGKELRVEQITDDLNKYGLEGWELVAAFDGDFIYKRKLS